MSGRPILDDTDFNFTEIMKGRLENVSSLPSGLGSDEKGYSVYYAEKIWVWDGINWNTWDSVPWTYEDSDVLDPNNPRLEETVVFATSSFLHTKSWNIAMSEGYSDNSANTVGTLHFIGAADIISNWDEIKGRRFVYTAKNGSWFNIKDNSSELVPDNHKKIDTRTETDILGVVKAEFSYDYFQSKWILISFERKQITNWFKRFTIPPTPLSPQALITDNIPNTVNEGFPFDGFYHVDIFLQTKEYEADQITRACTELSQTLEIYGPGDIWKLIDESGSFQAVPEQNLPKWFNNSLQGSTIVHVQENLCGQRVLSWRVNLPNGTHKQILGGYLHAQYIGEEEGNLCQQET